MADLDETQTTPEAAAEPAAEEKPRRRTRRASTKVVTEAPQAQDATEEAPAPKPRRRTKAKAEAPAEAPAEAAEATADAPAEKPAEKPARRRTTRAKKAQAEAEQASAETPAEADASAKESAPAVAEKQLKAEPEAAEAKAETKAEAEKPAEKGADKSGKQGAGKNSQDRRQQRRQHNQNREVLPSLSFEDLEAMKVAELRARAQELEIEDPASMKKPELVAAVYAANMRAEGFREVEGVLDILTDGYGFVRTQGYLPSETDCYMGTSLIKRNNLRKGDYIKGQTRPTRDNEKFAAIQKIISVNGIPPEQLGKRPRFADLIPVYPDERLVMEHGKNTTTARVIDLVAPIGKGQRGLIVSPPKAGKTTILKDIAAAISANNPEVHLMCLLVDERPEEVTDMQRSIKGEVIHSTFDMPADNHIAVAELVIERAKRLVECGRDVVIVMDSITRLARAYNLAQPASGRVLSGGVDSTALYPPKRFLGAARNIENGGSLTILATALIETGSKMDEVIFEEFKGTGNMELRLDRALADRRIFPAIDPVTSGTRKEELLLDPQMAPLIWAVRRILANLNNTERAMDTLIKSIKQTEDNQEFLLRMARKAKTGKSETLDF